METKDFLQAFHGRNQINFRVLKHGKPIDLNGIYNDSMAVKLKQLNTQGYDIYFVVNGGGTKQNRINKINAVYIDYDAGKDEQGVYLPLEKVAEYKRDKLEVINAFAYKPSFIVETRNGLHVYWLVKPVAAVDEFMECQLRLIQYFKSDSAIKTPERIMRLPNYYWMKYENSPFMSKIISHNDVRYDIKDIIEYLPPVNSTKANSQATKLIPSISSKYRSNNINLIRMRDIAGLQNAIAASLSLANASNLGGKEDISSSNFILHSPLKSPLRVKSRAQLYDVICKIDLPYFLGVCERTNFNCLFHNDKSPSASIFKDHETGHYIYKCHSASCGFAATIIKIVEKLQDCRLSEAINFIKEVYNIELEETQWQVDTKQMMQSNIEYLLSGLMKVEYPALYQRLRHYTPELLALHEIAILNVKDEPITTDGSMIFYTPLSQIVEAVGKNSTKEVCTRIGLLAFLSMIEKLPEEKIPEKMRRQSKRIALKNKGAKHRNIPNFFAIPSYDYKTLTNAEAKALEFKAKNMSKTGFSRDMLLRIYGKAEADRVYPQSSRRMFSKAMQDFASTFDQIVLNSISEKGYATESEILGVLNGNKDENKRKIKRVLQETLEKYGLKRPRANSILKNRYGITAKGYPFLIVPEQ